MSLDDLQRDQPFSYRATKSGTVHIAFHGKTVTTLSGRDAARFLGRLEAAGAGQAQLVMAKATGHFKRGTERAAGDRRSDR